MPSVGNCSTLVDLQKFVFITLLNDLKKKKIPHLKIQYIIRCFLCMKYIDESIGHQLEEIYSGYKTEE